MPSEIKHPRAAAEFFAPDAATARTLELMHANDRFMLHAQSKSAALIDGIERQKQLLNALKKASLEGKNFEDLKRELAAAKPGHDEARLRTVFNVNLRTAYNAARYEQQMKSSKPFFRYVSAGDSRVRDEHAAFHGLVLAKDDAFWDTNYPPNGFNCRCKVQAISEREAKALGAKRPPNAAPPNIPQGGFKSDIRPLLHKSKEHAREHAAQGAIDLVNDKLARAQITSGAAYEAIQSELKELKAVQLRMKHFDGVLKRQKAEQGFSKQLHQLGKVRTLDGKTLPLVISDETIYSHFVKPFNGSLHAKHPEITSFELAALPQAVQNINSAKIDDTHKSVGYNAFLGGKWFRIAIKNTGDIAFITSIFQIDKGYL